MLTPSAPGRLAVAPLVEALQRLERAHGPPCAAWAEELFDLVLEMRGHELDFQARVFTACAWACDLDFVPQISELGFAVRVARGLFRSPDVADFDAVDCADLRRLAEAGAPIAFAARAMDLGWLVLGDPEAARSAVAAYMHLAIECAAHGPQGQRAAADAVVRASQLVVAAQCDLATMATFAQTLAEVLALARTAGDGVLLLRCVEVHARLGLGDPDALSALAMQRAELAVVEQRDHTACAFYRAAERCIARSTRPTEGHVLAAVRAGVLADAARQRRARGEPEWVSVAFLHLALDELGTAPLAQKFRAMLQREIDDLTRVPAQRCVDVTAPSCMPAPSSVARAIQFTAEQLDQLAPLDRPLWLASLPAEPDLRGAAIGVDFEKLRMHTPELEGPSAPVRSADARRAAGRAWGPSSHVFAGSVVEVARRALAAEPAATRDALAQLLDGNALVGREHAAVFERGLLACIDGDAARGLSLLVPQLDAWLRGGGTQDAWWPALRCAAEALLEADGEWGLRPWLAGDDPSARGKLAEHGGSQGTANLVLWLVLRVLRRHARAMRLHELRASPRAAPGVVSSAT